MKKMNEDKWQKLQGIIDKLIDTKDFIYIWEVNSRSHGTKTNFKLGLYYLYDANEIIYIGKVGGGCKTSFYSRMIGHGNGAHKAQDWYNEVVKCKFHRFDNFNDSEIELLERLSIQKHHPKYNDKNLSENVLGRLLKKFETHEN